ncbi:MAG: hypothetical protein DI567_02210 [Aliarcobacter butzleri]|nr:MAG: hypothetical protein DI567_02210 [Aliarcobacter butzleri]
MTYIYYIFFGSLSLLFIKNIKVLYIILSKNEQKTIKVVHWKSKYESYNKLQDKTWVMIGEPTKFKYYTTGLDLFKKEFSYDERIEEIYKYSEITLPKYYKSDGKIIYLPFINQFLTIINIIFGRARLIIKEI